MFTPARPPNWNKDKVDVRSLPPSISGVIGKLISVLPSNKALFIQFL
jgi:hypothetical protein